MKPLIGPGDWHGPWSDDPDRDFRQMRAAIETNYQRDYSHLQKRVQGEQGPLFINHGPMAREEEIALLLQTLTDTYFGDLVTEYEVYLLRTFNVGKEGEDAWWAFAEALLHEWSERKWRPALRHFELDGREADYEGRFLSRGQAGIQAMGTQLRFYEAELDLLRQRQDAAAAPPAIAPAVPPLAAVPSDITREQRVAQFLELHSTEERKLRHVDLAISAQVNKADFYKWKSQKPNKSMRAIENRLASVLSGQIPISALEEVEKRRRKFHWHPESTG